MTKIDVMRRYLDSLPIGIEINVNGIRRETDRVLQPRFMHDSTITRYIRLLRQNEGYIIPNVSRKMSTYYYGGKE